MARHVITTGHKTFDRQSEGSVFVGNAVTPVQHSGYIRARTDVRCNNLDFKEGELRESDLKPFSRMPAFLLHRVLEATDAESAILYRFSHLNGGEVVVHGYILTKAADYHELLRMDVTGPTSKSNAIMERMAAAVSNPLGSAHRFRTALMAEGQERAAALLAALDQDTSTKALEVLRVIHENCGNIAVGECWRAVNGVAECRPPYTPQAICAADICERILAETDEHVDHGVRAYLKQVEKEAGEVCGLLTCGSSLMTRMVDGMVASLADVPHPAGPTPG